MADDIRITKTENGGTIMVNVTAINEFIHQASLEGTMDILKNGISVHIRPLGERRIWSETIG